MTSDRITLSILPAQDSAVPMEIDDCTQSCNTGLVQPHLEEVVQESPLDNNTFMKAHDDTAVNITPDVKDIPKVLPAATNVNQDQQKVDDNVQQMMSGLPQSVMESTTNQSVQPSSNGIDVKDIATNQTDHVDQPETRLEEETQEYNQQFLQQFFPNQYQSPDQIINTYDQTQNFTYVNDGINIIDPSVYSPMVYVVEGNKMVYSSGYPFVYDSNSNIHKNSTLPYAYISRNSYVKPDFNIVQNKLKLYNYWIETTNPKQIEEQIVNMFGSENIYVTKSLFFRKKSSYMGEKVILVNKLPQKPFKFINRINRTFTTERRSVKSVLGDYIISPDCLFIVLAERSIDYICNNYYRYHKNERVKIETLVKSFKTKFTCINEADID